MYDYLLNIKVPFKTYDNIEARLMVRKFLEKLIEMTEDEDIRIQREDVKLQLLQDNKAPEGVKF